MVFGSKKRSNAYPSYVYPTALPYSPAAYHPYAAYGCPQVLRFN